MPRGAAISIANSPKLCAKRRQMLSGNFDLCFATSKWPRCDFAVSIPLVPISRISFVLPRSSLWSSTAVNTERMKNIAYDEQRTRFLNERGYRVLRFANSDLTKYADAVLESIWRAARESGRPLPEPPDGGSTLPQGEGMIYNFSAWK
jgi:hypothetical protein